jgi:uncharacterized protein (DUF2141 family)
MRVRALGGVAVACGLATAASAATVTVTVEDVPNDRGEVHVNLCDAATFLGSDCPFDVHRLAHRGRVVVKVRNVPPGRYAAVAYHDENANRDLDVNFLGLPEERFGFTNDPVLLLGPPSFKDCAFDVGNKGVTVKIRLKR